MFREEWKKYRESFYKRCQTRSDGEHDVVLKRKLFALGRKVKKVYNATPFVLSRLFHLNNSSFIPFSSY